MSYFEETLPAREPILFRIRYHWSYSLIALLYLGISVLISMYILWWIVVPGLLVAILLVAKMFLTERVVTRRRLLLQSGILSRTTSELALGRITQVRLKQSLLQRMFGCADFVVQTTHGAQILLRCVARPKEFQKKFNELV